MFDKDEVLQAIEKLVKDNGYDLINNGSPYPPEKQREVLYLAVQPKDGEKRPLLNFVVSWSYRFLVTFEGAKSPEYFEDLDQMLTCITEWLQNNRVLS